MPDKTRWLLLLCLAQIFIMLAFINYSASGVILSTLTDRLNTKRIFLVSVLWSGTANLLFALYAHDYLSGMIFLALTGIGMGGTYMPGLKLVAEKFSPHERGKAVGIYTGALVLGASLSLFAFKGYRPVVHAMAGGKK